MLKGDSISDGSTEFIVRDSRALPLSGGTLTGNFGFDLPTNVSAQIGIAATNNRMIVHGANKYGYGASLYLYGKDYNDESLKGTFHLYAHDGSSSKGLIGYPDGKLTFGGNHIPVVIKYTSGTSGYRKYSDGFIEQWGYVDASKNNNYAGVTFLIPFSNTNYKVLTSVCDGAEGFSFSKKVSTTSANIYVSGGNKARDWYACGY